MATFQISPAGFASPALVIFSVTLATFLGCTGQKETSAGGDEFVRLMNVGKSLYEKGDAVKAVDAFERTVALAPSHIDGRLNLANAYLLAGRANDAIQQAQEVLKLDPKFPAAYYIEGCSYVRLSKFDEAIQSLQTAKNFDVTVNPASFQLARAFQGAGKFDDALKEFKEVTEFETNKVAPIYLAAQYNISQVLVRLGRTDEANQALEEHRKLLAQRGQAPPADVSTYERCVYTEARVPFVLEEPAKTGIKVRFSDATHSFFGDTAKSFRGPMGVVDINHRGANDLFLREGEASFRLLMNEGGKFTARGEALPVTAGAKYSRVLVGDLNNDRNEDVIVVGDKGLHAFRFATNGAITEATAFAGLKNSPGTEGALVDLDFTGKLDLLLVPPGSNSVRVLRNLGNMYFKDVTATSGVPASVSGPRQLVIEDWNNDDIMDVFVAREDAVPLLLVKERGGALTISNLPAQWPKARAIATGDLNNDLRADLVLAGLEKIECVFNGSTNNLSIPLGSFHVDSLALIDYDNDGWLDILAAGDGLRVWRNIGRSGFRDVTAELGFDKLVTGKIDAVVAADFDNDCDIDLLVSVVGQGLQLLRNEGGSANKQLKLQLIGNRSNASGLGMRVEVTAGNWRTLRTVQQLPVEIGVGNHAQLDSVNVHWADLAIPQAEVDMKSCAVLAMIEFTLPTGSCPYLYAWNGNRFRFVTDILGASPVGLPVAEGRYIEADPDEYVWIGNENTFPSRDGHYVLQITEELREVLYLDEAKLVVVDHPADVEIYPSDKLLPGKPFPPAELVPLHRARPLRHATRTDGMDVTELLREADGRVVSPTKLRVPQLRGLAEPHSITLDFGPLDVERPLVLGLTGWLRFGGGMANVSASHDPNLPFPFPSLEVQRSDGTWQAVEVAVGAPAGKTKRLFVDLASKLPAGSRLLRLNTAFEIHWDRAVLFERASSADARQVALRPDKTDLHWRGFSDFTDLPWTQPLTPDYDKVRPQANWRITPAGWCTRYGPVDELIAKRDDALALLNGGDELTLSFAASKLPPKPKAFVRDFFLYTVGWDKDSDFHVKLGTKVEPLPYTGMNDQRYGEQQRPEHLNSADALMQKFNTRWVGPTILTRKK